MMDDTAEIVRMIFDMYVNQRIGTHTISQILNDKGYRTEQGNLSGKNYIRLIFIKSQLFRFFNLWENNSASKT